MARWVYVDNSNLFIEARKLAAVKKGYAPSMRAAQQARTTDNEYFIDYFRLRDFLSEEASLARAVLFGSKVTADDAIWEHAEAAGWKVFAFERNQNNREKKIDIAVVTEMLIDAFKYADPNNDEIVLLAGDSDYLPAVVRLREEGFVVVIYFWSQAAAELKHAATVFIEMDSHLEDMALL